MVVRSKSDRTTRHLALMATTASLALTVAAGASGGSGGSTLPLKVVGRVPLSGAAVRFDYTSLDPSTNKLWISHMNASELLAFDVRTRKIVKTIPAPGVHGVIAVPQLGRIFASATDAREVTSCSRTAFQLASVMASGSPAASTW